MNELFAHLYTGRNTGSAALSAGRRNDLLGKAEQGSGGLISDIAWLLDTPGAMVRGALSGTGAIEALGQTSEERTDGRELLRQAGLAGSDDNWGNFLGQIGTEIALDPLSMLSGPIKALSPAGKIAAKAGLLNRAPELLSRKYIATKGVGMAPELASRAAKGAANIGEAASLTNVAGRPLVGRRAAQRYGTLQDLVEYADDPVQARRGLLDAVRGNEAKLESLLPRRLGGDIGIGLPLGESRVAVRVPGMGMYSDGMDTLMNTIRWSGPGRYAHAFFDKRTGQAVDAQSQAIYSGADMARERAQAEARRESTFQAAKLYQGSPETFTEEGNRSLGRMIERPAVNTAEAADNVFASNNPAARQYAQWWSERADQLADEFTEAGLRGTRFSDPNVAGYLPRRADGLLEQAAYGDQSLSRVLNTRTTDQARRSTEMMVPGGRDTIAFDLSKDPFIAGGKRLAKNDEEAAQHIADKLFGKRFYDDDPGLEQFDLDFPGLGYPQIANREGGDPAALERMWRANPDGTYTFSPYAARNDVFEAPDGRMDGLWADPRDFPELFSDSPRPVTAAVAARPPHSPEQMKQARGLAQILNRLPDNVIKDVPLFGQHPTQTIARYMEGRAGAKATMEAIYDSLAASTNLDPANLAEGGKHIPMTEALQRVGGSNTADALGEVGAKENMRRRLGQKLGGDPDKVDLARLSVPEELVVKLTKAREAYEQPQVALEFSKVLSAHNRTWKSAILAWPGRIVRDLQSGAFSNWLEGALDIRAIPVARQLWDVLLGGPFATGKDIALKSAFDPQAVAYLQSMPRYASTPVENVAAEFYADLAATGLLDAGRTADRSAIVKQGNVADLLPGIEPQTFLFGRNSAVSELASRNWNPLGTNPRKAFLNENFWDVDKNPISRAGAKAGNLSDMINRVTGYLSLLRQGIEPTEAARRMKRAQVDYASLSPTEKYIRDNFVPFYAYMRNITQEVFRQMAERPGGRYGQGIRTYERMQESNPDYVPSALRNQFSAAIDPDDPLLGFLADPDRTTTTYYTGLDLPGFHELQMYQRGEPGDTTRNALTMLNPVYRTAGEFATGRDAFYGTPINEVARGYGIYSKLSRAISGNPEAGTGRGAIALDKALDLVPYVARPGRALTQAINPDTKLPLSTNAFVTAFNQMGAGRLRDVTAEDIRRDQIDRLQRAAAPWSKDYSVPSIPKGLEGRVPRDAVDSLALARELQREGRQLRRRRLEQRSY